MALYVNTNVSSLTAQRKLNNAVGNLNVSYQRLSSGLRINSAKDDSAGLQISNRLTSQINGLEQGNRNANDGIALAQTIEGALEEQGNMLQRIRTLAVQAANGTNTDADRKAIQQEVTQLSVEISRIAKKTTFAGAQVLDGKAVGIPHAGKTEGMIDFQVGANANDVMIMDVTDGFNLSTLYSKSIAAPKKIVQITDNKWDAFKANGAADKYCGMVIENKQARWCVSTAALAQMTLDNIDDAIAYVDSKRAEFGALQNRMESTIRNQANVAENEADARSRIRDTDFAAETAAMTQGNIIQQASQSILAQANQRPQLALQLLG